MIAAEGPQLRGACHALHAPVYHAAGLVGAGDVLGVAAALEGCLASVIPGEAVVVREVAQVNHMVGLEVRDQLAQPREAALVDPRIGVRVRNDQDVLGHGALPLRLDGRRHTPPMCRK